MAKYETMMVISTKLGEEEQEAVVSKFKKLIEKNGTIEAVDEWGKRRLAYPINKEEEGVYTLIYFTAEPDFPTELERRYRITDGVLRSLIIARDEDAEVPVKAEKVAPKEEAPKAEAPKAEAAAEPVAAAPAAEAEKVEEAAAAPAEEPKADTGESVEKTEEAEG